jgi:hypothetical protein
VDTRTQKAVARAIQSFRPDAAAGLSGLRPAHIKEALKVTSADLHDSFLLTVSKFVVTAANGALPADLAAYVNAGHLIPFQKDDQGGVRPIVAGESLARLVSRFLCRRFRKKLKAALLPVQFGVGIPAATEHIIHTVRAVLDEDSETSVLQLDLQNAFNTVSRQAVLDAVYDLVPEFTGWATYTLTEPSPLWVGQEKLFSQEGVRQGDPLSPALFALATISIAQEIHANLDLKVVSLVRR